MAPTAGLLGPWLNIWLAERLADSVEGSLLFQASYAISCEELQKAADNKTAEGGSCPRASSGTSIAYEAQHARTRLARVDSGKPCESDRRSLQNHVNGTSGVALYGNGWLKGCASAIDAALRKSPTHS